MKEKSRPTETYCLKCKLFKKDAVSELSMVYRKM